MELPEESLFCYTCGHIAIFKEDNLKTKAEYLSTVKLEEFNDIN